MKVNKWIVILNKVPRGPLSQEEVRALLEQGILKHNDVGFLVPASQEPGMSMKQASEWKLLWRFPEFDRRLWEKEKAEKNQQIDKNAKNLKEPSTSNSSKTSESDRRQQVSEKDVEKKTKDAIPSELLDIAPEELVVKARSRQDKMDVGASSSEYGENNIPGFVWPVPLYKQAKFYVGLVTSAVLLMLLYWGGKEPLDKVRKISLIPEKIIPNLRIKKELDNSVSDSLPEAREHKRPEMHLSNPRMEEEKDRGSDSSTLSDHSTVKKRDVRRLLGPDDDMPEGDRGEISDDESSSDGEEALAYEGLKKSKKRQKNPKKGNANTDDEFADEQEEFDSREPATWRGEGGSNKEAGSEEQELNSRYRGEEGAPTDTMEENEEY